MDVRTPASPPRKSKPLLIVLVVIGVLAVSAACAIAASVALLVPVRSEITEVDPTSPEAAPPVVEAESGIEAEATAVAESVRAANQDWSGEIARVEVITLRRRPLILISTNFGAEQADLSATFESDLASFVNGLVAADGSPYTYYLQIISSDGEIVGLVASTDGRWALDAPAAPSNAADLSAWLQQVYGSDSPDPENWLDRITEIGTGTSDSSDYLIVRTDLDPNDPADLRAAQTIIDAVNSSGATFARGVRVLFADGAFEWSSTLTGIDPYCP